MNELIKILSLTTIEHDMQKNKFWISLSQKGDSENMLLNI